MSEPKRAEIRTLNGRPCLYYDGRPMAYGAYWIRNFSAETREEILRRKLELVKLFAGRGIHTFETASIAHGWSGPEQFDPDYGSSPRVQRVDQKLAGIVETDPEALVMVGAIFRTPPWWAEAHPEECETNEYGDRFGASLGSDRFRCDIAAAARRFVEFVEASPYRDHVIAYDLWWVISEGFTEGCLYNAACDFSPAMTAFFRAWLREHYRDDLSALRAAWRDASVTFEMAAVPTLEERRGPDGMSLLDPTQSQRVLDYYACQGEGLYRTWTALLGAGKEACGGRALVGTYGGYLQVAGWSPNYWGSDGPAGVYARRQPFQGMPEEELHTHLNSGQFAWTRILEHPAVDFLASPFDYYYRKWGAPMLNQGLGESATLRGKLFFINEDSRTHLHGSTHYGGAESLAETRALYRRNFAAIHTTCSGCNWMEQATNWLNDPDVLNEVARFNTLLQRGIHWADEPDPAGALCVLIDEESLKYQAPFTDLDFEGIYKMRVYGLSHCGVPLKIHAFRDLERDDFPAYKGYVFLNLWHLTPERLDLLRRKVLRDGNVAVWQYAPGYVTDGGLSLDSMQALTGIRFRTQAIRWEHLVTLCNWQHPLTRDLPGDCWYGTARRYGPAFLVDDPDATTLGWLLLSQGRHEPGLAVKEMGRGARGNGGGERGPGDFASLYSEAPLLPAGLVRAAARYAGCHVYDEENDVVYAGRGILAVHAPKPGRRHLRLPRPSRVWDLHAREVVAEGVSEFEADFPEPGTRVFYLGEDPGA